MSGTCTVAQRYVFCRALIPHLETEGGFDDLVGWRPLERYLKYMDKRDLPDVDPTNWIPGDWGYIEGGGNQNILYLGGSSSREYADFAKESRFFGHTFGMRVKSLEEWMASTGAGAKLTTRRWSYKSVLRGK